MAEIAALVLGAVVIFALATLAYASRPGDAVVMAKAAADEAVPRVSVKRARTLSKAGRALLVCAYKDEGHCKKMLLDRALTLKQLRSKVSGLDKNARIFFYCG